MAATRELRLNSLFTLRSFLFVMSLLSVFVNYSLHGHFFRLDDPILEKTYLDFKSLPTKNNPVEKVPHANAAAALLKTKKTEVVEPTSLILQEHDDKASLKGSAEVLKTKKKGVTFEVEKGKPLPVNWGGPLLSMNMIEDPKTFPMYVSKSQERARDLGRYTGPFDLVYLWANATQEWMEERNVVMEKYGYGRKSWSPTRDNGELRLSIRSVERYLPWIRNIYIFSNDGQIPSWMDTGHPRIRFVDSNKLLKEKLNATVPSFNSHALYLASAFLPELSEIYLQMDDDFIIGQPLPPDFFFWEYQHEITSVVKWARRGDLIDQKKLLHKIIPNYVLKWATHMPRCWNKTRVQELWKLHEPDVTRTVNTQLRMASDIDLTSFYAAFTKVHYDNLIVEFQDNIFNTSKGKLVYQSKKRPLHFYGTMEKFLKGNYNNNNRPALVCLQDQGDDAESLISSFDKLAKIFDIGPSSFEKIRYLPVINATKVFGHRGVGFTRPNEKSLMENSMESISASAKAGLQWVEIDVGVTDDGIVIVGHFHNNLYEDCPKHTLGKIMDVSKTTYDELRIHAERAGLPVPPKLSDILAEFKGILGFQIELKQHTNYGRARKCNSAAASSNLMQAACKEGSQEQDKLLYKLAATLEQAEFPADKIIISSFEAPRLHNFRQISSTYHQVKLVGAQREGVEGIKRISQMYLGQNSFVALPLNFATQERVNEIRRAGISVEIGLPSAGHCLGLNAKEKEFDPAVVKKELMNAFAQKPDSICTDFPRDALGLITV